VDATAFVDEMKIWTEQRKVLLADQETIERVSPGPGCFPADLSRMYVRRPESLPQPTKTKR
jgi:site-specific DNA recombinase